MLIVHLEWIKLPSTLEKHWTQQGFVKLEVEESDSYF